MDPKCIYTDANCQKSFRDRLWSANRLARELTLADQFIQSRQILNIDDFCNPTIKALMPNPAYLVDIDRLIQCILQSKHIGIFGDYDADGITSTVMWKKFLDAAKIRSSIYIPNRMDGYGASKVGIEALLAQGVDTLLFLDCGTTAVDLLNSLTIPVCIIDHHQASSLPSVAAIVNPHRNDCLGQDEYKSSCTSGLVFLVLARLAKHLNINICMSLLDLAAIGLIGDVMSITGFNKACIKRGLELINQNTNSGLVSLIEQLGLNYPITTSALSFYLIPCLNAAGRLADATLSLRLLLSTDLNECSLLSRTLHSLNLQRRTIEQAVFEEAKKQIDLSHSVIFAMDSKWHPGVVGIVAGRFKEIYNKTSFVFYKDGSYWKGSARGCGVDVGKLIKESVDAGLAQGGGGHAAAGGVAVHEEQMADWIEWLKNNTITIESSNNIVKIDACVPEHRLTEVRALSTFGPFGMGNPSPRILLESVWLKSVTNGANYTKCMLNSGRTILGFKCTDEFRYLLTRAQGRYLDLLLMVDEAGNLKLDDAGETLTST